jgi:hypothetical protein
MKPTRTIPLLLSLATVAAFAGAPSGKAPNPVAPPAEENPLSFFGGKLVLDFQERLRYEVRSDNFDFNNKVDSITDDDWLLEHTRLGVKFQPVDWLTFYAQGQDVREFGSDRPNVIGQFGAEGDDTFDLRQGYVEIGKAKDGLSVKIGRQILSFGDERLVGPLEWANQSRSFDAVKVHYQAAKWSLDAFTSSVVRFQDKRFNESDFIDESDTRKQIFSGIYLSSTLLDFQVTDLYAFELHERNAGKTDFVTLGTRVKGDPKKFNGWDYESEMAVQFGDLKGKDLNAFAGHWGAGYNWMKSSWKPRLAVEYNYATGDSSAADGKIGTFQNLFPTNHPFYGYADFFSWQNVHNPELTFTFQPTSKFSVKIDYHLFWAANTHDAWYRANGVTQVRPINAKADSFEGSELDLTLKYKVNKNLTLQTGYSHFFAGDYLKATGANDDADFAYFMATIDF